MENIELDTPVITEKRINTGFVEDTERTRQLREVLLSDFKELLTSGGIVTVKGTELPVGIDEEDVADKLPTDIREELMKGTRVLKTMVSKIREVIGGVLANEKISSTKVYIFGRGAIEGLAYKELKQGALKPLIVNRDGTLVTPFSYDNEFPAFFANRTKAVLKYEKIDGSHYRFATLILKELADNFGLGSIKSEKAQQAINENQLINS